VKDKQIDICKRGHEERFVPLGYHKIPGDSCTNGFRPPEAKMIDLSTECDDDTVGPSVYHGETKSEQDAIATKEQEQTGKNKAVVVVVILLLAGVITVVVLLTVYGRKYRARQLSFRYMSIKADGEQGGSIAPLNTSIYQDSSDEEVPGIEVADIDTRKNTGRVANGKPKTSNWNSAAHESDDDLLH